MFLVTTNSAVGAASSNLNLRAFEGGIGVEVATGSTHRTAGILDGWEQREE